MEKSSKLITRLIVGVMFGYLYEIFCFCVVSSSSVSNRLRVYYPLQPLPQSRLRY